MVSLVFNLLRRKHKVKKKSKKRQRKWIKRRITCSILKWQEGKFEITKKESDALWKRQHSIASYICMSCLCSICKSGESASSYNDLLSRLLVHASDIHILVSPIVSDNTGYFIVIYQAVSMSLKFGGAFIFMHASFSHQESLSKSKLWK